MNVRKIVIIVLFIMAAVVAGIILIRDKDPDTDFTAVTTRVGLVINGSFEDRNYCQAHYDALCSLKDELNLEIICRQWVPENSEECYTAIKELIEKDKCTIIVAASEGYGEYARKAAMDYPEIYFLYAMGIGKRKNLSSFSGRMYQARYLSGIVAGMRTQTGEVGYVAAMPCNESIRDVNAFAEGIRRVRPGVKVHVKYTGDWNDDEAAGKASSELMDELPVDLIAVHVNSIEPHYEADRRGVWSIGCNMENAERFPNTYLTACEYHWESYYEKQIMSILQGKFHSSFDWMGLEDGVVGISKLTSNVPTGTDYVLDHIYEHFKSLTFDVFYGKIADDKGVVRVDTGESMSDREMLNGFDWFVEGVSVEK